MTVQEEITSLEILCVRGIWWHLDGTSIPVDTVLQDIVQTSQYAPRNMVEDLLPYALWNELLDYPLAPPRIRFWTHEALRRVLAHHHSIALKRAQHLTRLIVGYSLTLSPTEQWKGCAQELLSELTRITTADIWAAELTRFMTRIDT